MREEVIQVVTPKRVCVVWFLIFCVVFFLFDGGIGAGSLELGGRKLGLGLGNLGLGLGLDES